MPDTPPRGSATDRPVPTIRQLLNRLALATLLPAVLTMVGLLVGEYQQERLALDACTQGTAREGPSDFHRASIKKKLGLRSGAELIAFASSKT